MLFVRPRKILLRTEGEGGRHARRVIDAQAFCNGRDLDVGEMTVRERECVCVSVRAASEIGWWVGDCFVYRKARKWLLLRKHSNINQPSGTLDRPPSSM